MADTRDFHQWHQSEPLTKGSKPYYEHGSEQMSETGPGYGQDNPLKQAEAAKAFELLQLLRDVATVLGLREDSDQQTIRKLREYVKVGMAPSQRDG